MLAEGLFFSEKDVPRLRERTGDPKFSAVWRSVTDTADRVCAAGSLTFPEDTFTVFYFIRDRLACLALAALLTAEDRYARTLRKIVTALAAEPIGFWQGPAYPNRPRTRVYHGREVLAGELETAAITTGVVLAYEWGYSFFTEDERRMILTALREKAYPLLLNSTLFQMENWVMNHLCVIASALVQLLLLTEDDPERSPDLATALEALRLWCAKIESDGSYGEGYHYWSYPVNCLSAAAHALLHTTGKRIPGMHNLEKSFEWALYNQIGKYDVEGFDRPVAAAVNVHDCPLLFQMEAPEVLLYANCFRNPLAQWYLEAFLLSDPPRPDALHAVWHRMLAFLFALYDDSNRSEPPSVLDPDRVFAETGFTYLRSGWNGLCGDGNDTVLELQSGGGGRSRSHQHFDKNSILLHSHGEYLLVDPGHSCYRGTAHEDYDTHTLAHNTITINGKDQSLNFVEKGMLHDEVRDFTSHNNRARITFKDFHSDVCFVRSHAEKCYEPYLPVCVRSILYVKPGLFLVHDTVEAGTDDVISSGWNLNDRDGKLSLAVDGMSVTARRPKAALHMRFFSETPLTLSQESGRLHYAYHILPDQAVEGKDGSVRRLVLSGKGRMDAFVLLCATAPDEVAPGSDCRFGSRGAELTLRYGGKSYTVQYFGRDVLFSSEDGTHYVF